MSEQRGVYSPDKLPCVRLPYPDAKLSPNARGHWALKEQARKDAKETAYFATYQAAGEWNAPEGLLQLTVYVNPPANGRKHDLDNILASLKPSIDGACLALKVDDSRFAAILLVRGEPVKRGAVALEVGPYKNGNHPEWTE